MNDTDSQTPETCFTLIIEAQAMRVRYRPDYSPSADYGHLEFTSPEEPRRRIPVSETGYRSHFFPMWQMREAPSVEAYARAVALALMNRKAEPETDEDDDSPDTRQQLALF